MAEKTVVNYIILNVKHLDGDALEWIQRNSKGYEKAKIYEKKKRSFINNLIQQWLTGLRAILK